MLIKRMLQLFFKDRSNVFFSLLAVFIIIGVYVLFLGDLMEQELAGKLGYMTDEISLTMASITLGGIVAASSVTSCMGALDISIRDRKSAAKDFLTSPVRRGVITSGYIAGSAAVSLIMTLSSLGLCLLHIGFNGGGYPSPENILRLLLTVFLSVLCGNAMLYFIARLVKSRTAWGQLSTIIGTLVGFIMGVYIPVGSLPEAVQWMIKLFPLAHASSMFKQIMADGQLAEVFQNAPPEALNDFRELFGIAFSYGEFTSGFWFSAAVLAVTTVIFYGLSTLAAKKAWYN